MCHMGASSNLKPTYMSLPSHTSWSLIPCSIHSPFALQISDIPNQMVFSTNRTTWQHCRARSTKCTKPHAHAQPINCNIIPHKDTMIPYMNQIRHPLNNQVLTIFFPFATIPGRPHCSEFTDKYYTQSGRWSFSLYFMANILFSTFFPPFSHPLSTTQ